MKRIFTLSRQRLGSRHFCSQNAPRIVSAEEGADRMVTVQWADGAEGRFPVVWLRDCSPDPSTYTFSSAMNARNLWMRDFDVRQNLKSIQVDGSGDSLRIDWQEGGRSEYPSEWLRIRNPSCGSARKHRRKVYLFPEETWDKKSIGKSLKTFSYDDLMKEDKTLHDFLSAVCLDGVVRLRGGIGRGAVAAIGGRIGLIQSTHFGQIFEVSTKADASNMAYASNGELPFHTDFPSLSDPPQLQMLHMVSRAEEGGHSLFVDGFHIARLLKEERPDVYETLCRHSMEYIEEGYDVHEHEGGQRQFPFKMAARHRVIKTDETGRVVQIQFGNAMRSWFYDCPPEDIQSIYDAMKVFTEYCYQDRNVLKFQLEDGDTVLWANTRVLHTRDGFRNAPGKARALEGCYFCWDIVKSRVRQLRGLLRLPEDQPSA